jgi:leader peptidase (prepilin peptidase)/N-methyltransferase
VAELPLLAALPEWILVAFAAAWGAVWGSFATVIVWRYPRDESIVSPGSRCPRCLTPVRWHDNIPVIGYMLLRGRCRQCGAPIGIMYPAVELLCTLLALIAFYLHVDPHTALLPFMTHFFITFTFFWALFVIAIVDLESFLVPDIITLPGIVLFLAYNLIFNRPDALVIAISVISAYLVVFVFFNLLYRVLSGREGMGLGDAKLLAMIAALTGWKGGLFALIAGSAQGLLVNTPLLLYRRRKAGARTARRAGDVEEDRGTFPKADAFLKAEVPFGPMLALAAFEYVLWGDSLVALYISAADKIAWIINLSAQ